MYRNYPTGVVTLACDVKINQGQETPIIDIKRFSSYEKLITTTAMILFLCKQKSFKGTLHNRTSSDLKEAENYWIKIVKKKLQKTGKRDLKGWDPV